MTYAVLAVVLLLTAIASLSDLGDMRAHPHQILCVPARILRTGLLAWLAWYTGGRGKERRDTALVALALSLAVIGDVFLVALRDALAGLVCFGGVQLLLIARHRRILRSLRRASLWPMGAACLVSGGIVAVAAPILKTSPYFWPFLGFLALLTFSMGLAWSLVLRGGWRDANDIEAALGVTSFYLCDVCFGVYWVLSGMGSPAAGLARLGVDLFYTPALVLLVLSAHDWRVGFSAWLRGFNAGR